MIHFNRILVGLPIFLLLVTLFAIPSLRSSKSPFCLNGASAQDNPCLAQDATISAMQVELFQSTLDAMNSQATITALEIELAQASHASASASSTTPPSSIVFADEFSDNRNGWNLTGGVSITQGELALFGSGDAIVPFEVGDNFYLEVDARATDAVRSPFLVGFGNISEGTWHEVIFQYYDISVKQFVARSPKVLFEVEYRTLSDTIHRIGIESNGGQLNIFINGSSITTTQIENLGNELMLAKYGDSTSQQVFFDNLIIREMK